MDAHDFCRGFLRLTRREGEKISSIPKRITAIRSTKRTFFVEAEGVPGQDIKACCAFEAKAKFIHRLLRIEEERA